VSDVVNPMYIYGVGKLVVGKRVESSHPFCVHLHKHIDLKLSAYVKRSTYLRAELAIQMANHYN